MAWKAAEPRTRHLLIAAAILFAGAVSATVIYLRAVETPPVPMEFSAKTSKQYRHDLEVFGGTANVLAVQFMDWFKGLWQGKSLAYTILVIAAVAALGYLFFTEVAAQLPAEAPPERGDHGPG
jgi:ABC-type phosphate/phosphonate transport system permease subunit